MADVSPQGLTDKLLAAGFERSGPSAAALSDPIADTPMIVTLDQMRPYDHDPRVKRNPAYEEIKASIRERGLDAAPAITRRPGESHYIIRNGGNTRLAILRELWSETKNEQFYRISCLFRPWPERGEIVALTGHLAENELRGGLTFIERALGIEKARELYEGDSGAVLSQSELARRLAADGFPVQQSHISRMHDAVRYLLPAVPNVLYGGLGRHQVERLCVLRNAGARIWTQYEQERHLPLDFDTFFQEVLSPFDVSPDSFSPARVQDELIGQMAEQLQLNYDTLALDLLENEPRGRVSGEQTMQSSRYVAPPFGGATPEVAPGPTAPAAPHVSDRPSPPPAPPPDALAGPGVGHGHAPSPEPPSNQLQDHIVSPATTTERLQSIQKLVAEQMGDAVPDFQANVLQAIPVQAGGLYPISDVWYIEPGLDNPERLRVHIAQFASEIADEAGIAACIEACDQGIGYQGRVPLEVGSTSPFGLAVAEMLTALSGSSETVDSEHVVHNLAQLMYGHGSASERLSDTALVKLYRLIRLARRLLDLESGNARHAV
ncbi:ParB family protein [Pseudomonas chlororaphis]|uniref:ParB family protein n=1 Tax=Pseudomonas chlororaphis TaxID=587753 RepID=UPI0004729EEC|nr:ParB family protein [Pseudomonas chlororaphis]